MPDAVLLRPAAAQGLDPAPGHIDVRKRSGSVHSVIFVQVQRRAFDALVGEEVALQGSSSYYRNIRTKGRRTSRRTGQTAYTQDSFAVLSGPKRA